jgi:multidrug efflux pump subunit AcrA (membrane-fusion protein)
MEAPWARDATVRAHVVMMAPEVAGRIVELPVSDNKYVHKGDLLMEVDPTNYSIAVNQAEAAVQQAQANVQSIEAQMTVQQAQIRANQSQLDVAQAALVFAQQQAARYQDLAQKGYGSVQNAQQFTSQLHQQEAAVQTAAENLNQAAAASRNSKSTAPQRRGDPRTNQGPAPPSAGESRAHAYSLPGRGLPDEPAGAARRLRQRWREHHRRCRRQFHSGSTDISRRRTSHLSMRAIRPKSS